MNPELARATIVETFLQKFDDARGFMHWIAPSEKDTANGTLEKRLWDTVAQFRANSGPKAQEDLGVLSTTTANPQFNKMNLVLQR